MRFPCQTQANFRASHRASWQPPAPPTDLGPGEPLSVSDQAFFAHSLRFDLTRIRIHRGARAADATEALGARAFAVGPHIAVGRGELGRGDASRRLLAHEIAHTAQPDAHRVLRAQYKAGCTKPLAETGSGSVCPTPPGRTRLGQLVHSEIQEQWTRRGPDHLAEVTVPYGKKAPCDVVQPAESLGSIGRIDLVKVLHRGPRTVRIDIGEIKPLNVPGLAAGVHDVHNCYADKIREAGARCADQPAPSDPFDLAFCTKLGALGKRVTLPESPGLSFSPGAFTMYFGPVTRRLKAKSCFDGVTAYYCVGDGSDDGGRKAKAKAKAASVGIGAAVGGTSASTATAGVGLSVESDSAVAGTAGAGVSMDSASGAAGSAGIGVSIDSATAGAATIGAGITEDDLAAAAGAAGAGSTTGNVTAGVATAGAGKVEDTVSAGAGTLGAGKIEDAAGAGAGVVGSGTVDDATTTGEVFGTEGMAGSKGAETEGAQPANGATVGGDPAKASQAARTALRDELIRYLRDDAGAPVGPEFQDEFDRITEGLTPEEVAAFKLAERAPTTTADEVLRSIEAFRRAYAAGRVDDPIARRLAEMIASGDLEPLFARVGVGGFVTVARTDIVTGTELKGLVVASRVQTPDGPIRVAGIVDLRVLLATGLGTRAEVTSTTRFYDVDARPHPAPHAVGERVTLDPM